MTLRVRRRYSPRVIIAIRVEGLRGIRTGAVEGLGALSVLVGPNGSSKSTILDAVMLAASGAPGDAVGRVTQRRVELWGGARWLFWRGGRSVEPTARIEVDVEGAAPRSVKLTLLTQASAELVGRLVAQGARPPFEGIESVVEQGGATLVGSTALAYSDNTYAFSQGGARTLQETAPVRLVDPRPGGTHAPLWRSFTEAAERGLTREVEALVRAVVPDLERLQILADDAGLSILHLGFPDHSIPVGIAGDGIQTLVQVALAVAQPAGSTVLLEEPEATQHPPSLDQSARAIAAGVKRGVQVILSTHSLDLIDMLRVHLGDDLSMLTVHHLARSDGALSAVRYSGEDVALARDAIGEDLR